MRNGWTITIEGYVESWNSGTLHGAAPRATESAT
jgi:hypothetical protein